MPLVARKRKNLLHFRRRFSDGPECPSERLRPVFLFRRLQEIMPLENDLDCLEDGKRFISCLRLSMRFHRGPCASGQD